MVVKREFSESGSGSEFEDEEDVKPIITPKKPKAAPTKPKTPTSTAKSIQSTGSPSPGKKPKVDNSSKRIIAEEIIMVGIKGIDVDSLARATGLTIQQVRSQVAGGGRANLRKQLMDLAMSL